MINFVHIVAQYEMSLQSNFKQHKAPLPFSISDDLPRMDEFITHPKQPIYTGLLFDASDNQFRNQT